MEKKQNKTEERNIVHIIIATYQKIKTELPYYICNIFLSSKIYCTKFNFITLYHMVVFTKVLIKQRFHLIISYVVYIFLLLPPRLRNLFFFLLLSIAFIAPIPLLFFYSMFFEIIIVVLSLMIKDLI